MPIHKQLMSPSVYCPDIPREIVAALSPCVSARPSERPSSARALLDELAEASSGKARLGLPAERGGRARAGSQHDLIALPSRSPARSVEAVCPNCGLTFRGRSPGMNCSSCDDVLVEKVLTPRKPVSVPQLVKRSPSKPAQRPRRARSQPSKSPSPRNTDQPKQQTAAPGRSLGGVVEAMCPNCGLTFRGRSPGMNCSSCNRILVEKAPAPRKPVQLPPPVKERRPKPVSPPVLSKWTPTTTTEALCPHCGLSYRGRSAGDRCASCKAVLEAKLKPSQRPRRIQPQTSRDSTPRSRYLSQQPAALPRRSLVVDVEAVCPECGLTYSGLAPGMNCSSCNRVLVEKTAAPRSPVANRPEVNTTASEKRPSKWTTGTTTESICPQCGLSYRGRVAGEQCASCNAVLEEKPTPARLPNRVHEQTVRRFSPRIQAPRPAVSTEKLVSPRGEKNFRSTFAFSVISMLVLFWVIAMLVVWAASAIIAAVS